MTKRLFILMTLIVVILVIAILPVMAFGQTPDTSGGTLPQIPPDYTALFYSANLFFSTIAVAIIQWLKGLSWYPKNNSSWLDWTFSFIIAGAICTVLSFIMLHKFELTNIFIVAMNMVWSSMIRAVHKSATGK